jgi:hypothetical protein
MNARYVRDSISRRDGTHDEKDSMRRNRRFGGGGHLDLYPHVQREERAMNCCPHAKVRRRIVAIASVAMFATTVGDVRLASAQAKIASAARCLERDIAPCNSLTARCLVCRRTPRRVISSPAISFEPTGGYVGNFRHLSLVNDVRVARDGAGVPRLREACRYVLGSTPVAGP